MMANFDFLAKVLPYDVGPARVFPGEAKKTPMCGLGPASRVNKSWAGKSQDRSLDTVVRAVKWAYNPNHSPYLDASPNH